jgi:hypothetical protein
MRGQWGSTAPLDRDTSPLGLWLTWPIPPQFQQEGHSQGMLMISTKWSLNDLSWPSLLCPSKAISFTSQGGLFDPTLFTTSHPPHCQFPFPGPHSFPLLKGCMNSCKATIPLVSHRCLTQENSFLPGSQIHPPDLKGTGDFSPIHLCDRFYVLSKGNLYGFLLILRTTIFISQVTFCRAGETSAHPTSPHPSNLLANHQQHMQSLFTHLGQEPTASMWVGPFTLWA